MYADKEYIINLRREIHEYPEIPAINYENTEPLPDVPAELLGAESGLYLMPSGWDGNVFTQLMKMVYTLN